MTFIPRQEPFICHHCGNSVEPLLHGSYRNHCPDCLYSKHVDDKGPGDRASKCGGSMQPVGIDGTASKGFVLLHKCMKCGTQRRNKAANDDNLTAIDPLNVHD